MWVTIPNSVKDDQTILEISKIYDFYEIKVMTFMN